MNILKRLFYAILVFALLLSLTSCYFISAQPMSKLKGTYKLTSYTYTPTYERKEGVTPKTYDYVNGDEYKYEDYLIITGTSNGYYVHKEASGESYVKEITLRYEYSQDDSSRVEYVIYNDSVSKNSDEGGKHRLGVSKGTLNYSNSGIDFTQLGTKKKMHSESTSVRWEKVDKATDLSFVNGQISNMKYYKYDAFCVRGIYEISSVVDLSTNDILLQDERCFIVVDTANGVTTADSYFRLSDGEVTSASATKASFSANEDFSVLTIDGNEWCADTLLGKGYYTFTDGNYDYSLRLLTNDISDSTVQSYIDIDNS